jgi:hypothetical protein
MTEEQGTLDFAGIGVSRCGTTYLAKCLADHPDVFIPSKKELAFYNNPSRMENESIMDYFTDASPSQLWGEYTPRYIIDREALEHLARHNPDVKTVVSLRDPVERAYSQYKYFHFQMDQEKITDFEQAMTGPYKEDYIIKSKYATNIQRAWEIFGRDHVHVMFSHDFGIRPAKTIAELYAYLGVDTSFRPDVLHERLNESGTKNEGVLGTDLSSDDDVMVRGKRLDGLRSFGSRVSKKIGIQSTIEKVGDPVISATEQIFGKLSSNGQSELKSDDEEEIIEPNEATKARLYNKHFAEEVEQLEEMLDEDLSRWKY